MEDTNVAILVDAKEEYTKQLISILKSCIYQGVKSIYMDSKDICHQDNTPDNVLITFQDLLSRIPKWSQDIINKEFERISNVSKCDYIDDLLKVVYVSHIKVLTIVHRAQNNKKLSLKIPSGGHFIHLCYIECAREFWKDPYLLSDRGSKFEQQKNMRESETMIAECINETIRKQLPVRHILKEFLNEPDEDINEQSDDTDIKEPINKKYLKKLESVVKKELKTTHTNENNDINIELIRKVIREEMQGQSIDNKNNTKIEKDLVSNVIEKIVEQSTEDNVKDSGEKSIENSVEKSVETFENNNEMNKDTVVAPIVEPIVAPIVETMVEPMVEPMVVDEPVVNEPMVVDEPVVVKPVLEVKPEPIVEVKSEPVVELKPEPVIVEDNEISNTNLDSILNENNNNNYNENQTNDTLMSIQNNDKIAINNIDEINLNLDELDIDSECEEIYINDLTKIQLDKNNNEVNTNKNTKYIFFDDAKKL